MGQRLGAIVRFVTLNMDVCICTYNVHDLTSPLIVVDFENYTYLEYPEEHHSSNQNVLPIRSWQQLKMNHRIVSRFGEYRPYIVAR
jgi:hypothetical protein